MEQIRILYVGGIEVKCTSEFKLFEVCEGLGHPDMVFRNGGWERASGTGTMFLWEYAKEEVPDTHLDNFILSIRTVLGVELNFMSLEELELYDSECPLEDFKVYFSPRGVWVNIMNKTMPEIWRIFKY